jgi:hypothetical protein
LGEDDIALDLGIVGDGAGSAGHGR